MTKAFCTIITADYLHYALALNKSLLQFDTTLFCVLVVDQEINEAEILKKFHNIHFVYLKDLEDQELAQKIIIKYKDTYQDALRWSLKPVLINYLLNIYDKVIFLDCDLHFFNDFTFLFDELDNYDVLLTPHWRNKLPGSEYNSFDLLFYSGLFNAGFIACNKHAKKVMDWWATCCEYKCEINPQMGRYVDQTYLNLMPVYFENVKILKHQGCNVSEWNFEECKRTLNNSGEVLINNQFPIVFIHFTKYTQQGIKSKKDHFLETHLSIFEENLELFRNFSEPYQLKIEATIEKSYSDPKFTDRAIETLHQFKKKIRVKTRIIKFLKG